MRKAIAGALTLLAVMASSSALALNYAAPKWFWIFDGSPIDTVHSSYGISTCEEASAAIWARVVAHWAAQNDSILWQTGGCQPDNPDGTILYRTVNQDPNLPDRSAGTRAYCENGSTIVFPSFGPTLGLHCTEPAIPWTSNVGLCKTCVGNPIYPGWGNKLERALDYVGSGPFPLRFERIHNSMRGIGKNAASMGMGWSHSYYRRLAISGPSGGQPAIVSADRPDGRVENYNRSGAVFVADPNVSNRVAQVAGGWTLTGAEDEVELYDATGRLVSITNRAGLSQTLSYFAAGPNAGQLEKVTDPFGRTLTFEYTNLVVTAIVDPDGGRYLYGYDFIGLRRITGVTYPDGKSIAYHYEDGSSFGAITGITDENGARFATYGYTNIFGFPLPNLSEHAGGASKVTLVYPSNGNVEVTTHVSATASSTRVYTFQNVHGVRVNSGVSGPACPSCGPAAQTYDANGNVASTRDWNGNRANYTFDLARNLETVRTEALTAAGAATPQTRAVSTAWHATFRLPAQVAEPLRITTNTYDTAGNLVSRSVQATSDTNGSQGFGATPVGAARTWTYTYNANGSVLTVDGPRTDVADVTTYTYYANDDADPARRGQLATISNASGHTTSITAYNAHGQPLTIVDANGLTTTLTYDARRRLTSRSVGGETTTYDYDNAGQLTKVTLSDGSFLSYAYDAAHRLTGLQDNLGNRIAYTLDLAGNRTAEQVFDPANSLAQTRSRVYLSLNRLFQELGATGQTTEYTYDDQGNVATVKDPLNRTTVNQYDALNRLKQVTDPALGVTQYGYNGLDALTSVSDPRSLVTGYSVDGLGNLTQQQSPDTGTTASTYDAAGNLLTQTDAKGQTTSYAYDALNRVTLITFHDGARQTYAYDSGTNGVGRLTSITETTAANQVTSVIAYAYTQHGRVSTETRTVNGVSHVNAYQYDASGRLSGMTYPSGRSVAYAFDALGRVGQVTTTKDSPAQVVVQNVQYHPFGGVKSFTLGNGQIYSRTIDQDGRIAAYTLGNASYEIAFDPASRITGIAQIGNPANANTYGYDSLDRLTQALLPSSSFGYGYDAVGNRTSKTVGAATDTLTYSATSNRIATLAPASGPVRSFVFDANGSTVDDGLNQYGYDPRGRMVQATSIVGATSYQVNALGQRIRKTNSSTDTVFHYDTGGRLIAESDPGGTPRREYIYLGDIPVGVIQ